MNKIDLDQRLADLLDDLHHSLDYGESMRLAVEYASLCLLGLRRDETKKRGCGDE